MRNSLPLLTHLFPYLESDTPVPESAALAHILLAITEHEIEEGGPYAVDSAHGLADADIGLNMCIALFLRRLDVRLPKLEAYLEKALAAQAPVSRFFNTQEFAELALRYRSQDVPETKYGAHEADAPAWTREELAILTRIREQLKWRLRSLPEEFRDAATQVIERTIKGNPDKQMSLMPFFMRKALGKHGKQFSDGMLAELGLANVFFWTAFIIYDDFWDEDKAAEPRLLPIANLFARHYSSFFSTHATHVGLDGIFHRFMDKLEAANEWEIMHCRLERKGSRLILPRKLPEYGDFGIKFYPAAGHVIGPLSMLLELGYSAASNEVEALTDYFRHYLIAMQLNDDAHDWKEDLSRGHVSTAVLLLLGLWRIEHPEEDRLDIEKDMPELERLFWFKALPQLCEAILFRTGRAQQALDSIECIEDPAPLQHFIDRNKEAAETALDEQRRSIAFLEAMKSAAKAQE